MFEKIDEIEKILEKKQKEFAESINSIRNLLAKIKIDIDGQNVEIADLERRLEHNKITTIKLNVDNERERFIALDMKYIFEQSKVARINYEQLEQALKTLKKQIDG